MDLDRQQEAPAPAPEPEGELPAASEGQPAADPPEPAADGGGDGGAVAGTTGSPVPAPAAAAVKGRASPLIIRPAPLTPAKKKKIILQTLIARRSVGWGGRESPECRAMQDQSLISEYQDKEMVCPLCHRFFLGLMALQGHISSNHNQEQVGQSIKQPRPRKSLASLLSSAPRACMGAPRLLCSLCRELLPDEASLARHTKETHASASASQSSASMEGTSLGSSTSSADPGAAGLRIQMSNALGSLLDRALSNVLSKGQRPGSTPEGTTLNQLSLLQMTLKRGATVAKAAAAAAKAVNPALSSCSSSASSSPSATTEAPATAAKPPSPDADPAAAAGSEDAAAARGDDRDHASVPASHRRGRRASRASLPDASGDPEDPGAAEGFLAAPGKERAAGTAAPLDSDRPFACPACDDRFFTLSTRNRHIARSHAGGGGGAAATAAATSSAVSQQGSSKARSGTSQQPKTSAERRRRGAAASPQPPPRAPSPDDGDEDQGEADEQDDTDDLDGWRDLSPADWDMDPAGCEDGAGSFLCSDCGINFESPQDVLQHRRLEHSSQEATSNSTADQDITSTPKSGRENTGNGLGVSSVPVPLEMGESSYLSKVPVLPGEKMRKISDHSGSSYPVEGSNKVGVRQPSQTQNFRDLNMTTSNSQSPSNAKDHCTIKSGISGSSQRNLDSLSEDHTNKRLVKADSPKKRDRFSKKAICTGDDDETNMDSSAIRARAEAALRELNRQKARGSAASSSKWGLTFTVTESPEKHGTESESSYDRRSASGTSSKFNLPLVRKLPLGVGRYTSLAEKKKKNILVSPDPKKTLQEDSNETASESTPCYLEKTSLDIYEFEEDDISPSDFGLRTAQQQNEDKGKMNDDEETRAFRSVNGDSKSVKDCEDEQSQSKNQKSNSFAQDTKGNAFEIEAHNSSTENSMSALSSGESSLITVRKDDTLESSTSVSDMETVSENSKESFSNTYVQQRTRGKLKRSDPEVAKKKNVSSENLQVAGVSAENRKSVSSRRKNVQGSPSEETSDEICDENNDFPSQVIKGDTSDETSSSSSITQKRELPTSERETPKRRKSESETKLRYESKDENPSGRASMAASRRRRAKSDLLISIFAKSKRNFVTNSIISRTKDFVNNVPPSEDVSSDDSEQNGVVSDKKVMSSQVI